MKDYILGGVADAHLFDGDNLFGNAITSLTDSGINIAIQAEEVRGGKGAALLGRYFHSTGMTLTLTNATFNVEYLALSCGAEVENGGEMLEQEQKSVAGGVATLSKTPVPLKGCSTVTKVWARAVGSNGEWQACDVSGATVTVIGEDGEYCFKYFANNANAHTVTVKSDFVPKTLHLVLDADLFAAGDSACSAQTKVGKIIIDVPAFQLNGNQDLTMNMTGAATLNLEGTALAVSTGDASCEGGKYYAKISQIIFDSNWTDEVKMIAVDEGKEIHANEKLDIYAISGTSAPRLITPADLVDGIKVKLGNTDISADLKVPEGTSAGTVTISLVNGDSAIAATQITIVAGE